MNFDVTPELVVRWNLRPATLAKDAVFLPVIIRPATDHFLLEIGSQTFLGRRDTFGKSRRARDKGIEWTVSHLGSSKVLARGLYPEKIISDLVFELESLIVPAGA